MLGKAGITLALTALPLAAPHGNAAAAPVVIGCGTVVTKSIALQADLANCTGDGLVVGAPGIRIDLNGHAIFSPAVNSSAIPITPGSVGIRNAGFERVRIEDTQLTPGVVGGNGWIGGFETGILLTDANRNSVINVSDYDGLRLERSDKAIVRANQLSNWGGCDPLTSSAGLYLLDSDRATIRGNESHLGGLGVVLHRSHNNVLQGNAVAPSGSDGNDCSGIVLVDADGNRLVGNITSQNGGDGIFVDAASQRTTIDGNYAAWNVDDGIDVENRTTTILNTSSVRNRDLGVEAVAGVTASGNTANANTNPLQCLNVVCT